MRNGYWVNIFNTVTKHRDIIKVKMATMTDDGGCTVLTIIIYSHPVGMLHAVRSFI